ncbi:adenosylcobinamide-phosphate synthase CbiB [Salipaludibacillus aurantiacus]|uniref:Cobalamin biosynthesis protein CobD n=1 Tax=Salipaludibacillus aurantiacus TaxID=1601833 RepID=A0A1H9SDZ3_9BACI|nr:adenosylcobinamide-phosphate synthase CbiB [Salipaludibacillus aurantiacus]SER83232.1 adenosylcobinamide-phosphate synthase [Salipaludibacillus aurantiacus]
MEMLIPPGIIILMGAAVLLDLVFGDPKWLPHPVVGFGKLISFLEKKLNKGSGRQKRRRGVLLTAVIVTIVYGASFLLLSLFYNIHWLAGTVLEAWLISTTIAIKGLKEAALNVAVPLSQGRLADARHQLSMIVGRDTEDLDESSIVRGTVETVAENTVDGITAPLFWALIGGAPLAMAYRAVNTMDSMVGYKNERFYSFGWSAARLDDLFNWLPARLTFLTMLAGALFVPGARITHAFKMTLRDARKHPSPNSGWSEAAAAGLLGVQLGGRNTYNGVVSERAPMGEPLEKLRCCHIHRAITFMHGGWIVFLLLLILLAIIF